MRERPILFSAPMVRAILAGTKTQTRRILNEAVWHSLEGQSRVRLAAEDHKGSDLKNDFDNEHISCTYGQPGDRLYVRETWRVGARWDGSKPSDIPPNSCTVLYTAGGFTTNGNDGERMYGGECSDPEWAGKTRVSIHMPRWASRIDLEITGVRVERLNDISADDAWSEGIPHSPDVNPLHEFEELWQSINGAGSWDANPWAWVVDFRRLAPHRSHGDSP